MSKIKFVAMLWIMALLGWLMGGGALFEAIRFKLGEESAVMKSADPKIARALKFNPQDYATADVVLQTASGELAVSKFRVRPHDLPALAAGRGVAIRFRKGNPHEVLYQFEEKSWGLGWLLLGLAGTALGVFAHRKLKQESR